MLTFAAFIPQCLVFMFIVDHVVYNYEREILNIYDFNFFFLNVTYNPIKLNVFTNATSVYVRHRLSYLVYTVDVEDAKVSISMIYKI